MINRARPRYVTEECFTPTIAGGGAPLALSECNELYFNSEAKAFEFFLRVFNAHYHKAARVGIQAFTCVSMLDAICFSGSIAIIIDVKSIDASISLADIKREELDIVVVTHYQGVPNIEYCGIAEYCKENGILLIDDMAHVSYSEIDGTVVGSLCNIFLQSYRFDKPFVAITGARMHINLLEDGLKKELIRDYNSLPIEKKSEVAKDMCILKTTLAYTEEKNCYEDFDYSYFIKAPFLCNLWNSSLFSHSYYRFGMKYVYKLWNHIMNQDKNDIKRIHQSRLGIIAAQQDYFSSVYNELAQFDYAAHFHIIKSPGKQLIGGKGFFVWNRYSVLDENISDLAETMLKNLAHKNYNWVKILPDIKNKYPVDSIVCNSSYSNSVFLRDHIINIPVWHIDSRILNCKE